MCSCSRKYGVDNTEISCGVTIASVCEFFFPMLGDSAMHTVSDVVSVKRCETFI